MHETPPIIFQNLAIYELLTTMYVHICIPKPCFHMCKFMYDVRTFSHFHKGWHVLQEDIISEQWPNTLKEAVYAYQLDVLDTMDVWCYSATNPSQVSGIKAQEMSATQLLRCCEGFLDCGLVGCPRVLLRRPWTVRRYTALNHFSLLHTAVKLSHSPRPHKHSSVHPCILLIILVFSIALRMVTVCFVTYSLVHKGSKQ